MRVKPKVDLKKEATVAAGTAQVELITEEQLKELAKAIGSIPLARFKKAKTAAARADLLYEMTNKEWKEAKKAFDVVDTFLGKLEQWFIQEFRDSQTGVTGKFGRVEVKTKELATVEDWPKFYKHIQKKGEFDLLNKAINQKAVQERWEQNKQIAGVGKFVKKVVSLTSVKGK